VIFVNLKSWSCYPWQSTYGEGRWYDAFQGEFQPRTVMYDEKGQPVARAWSPYTASYARARRYANRYWLGGRRSIPFDRSKGKFETAAVRSDPFDVYVGYVDSRNGIPVKELPLGDRSLETVVPGPAYVAAADGVVYRTLPASPDKIESFAMNDGKGAWSVAAKVTPEIRDAFRLRAWVDQRPDNHRAWAAKRRAALPVNPEVTAE
jgi:hypothetical protein